MKAAAILLSLSFFALFTNLSLASSNDIDQVVDSNGNAIFPGMTYYIMPTVGGPAGGGVRLGKTGNSNCTVSVLQDYSQQVFGLPVKFTVPGISPGPGMIFTDVTRLQIKFAEGKPECAESSDWIVFVDDEIQKACVGIGGAEGHPGQETFSSNFHIQKYGAGYKLVFCVDDSSTICLDIGSYDNYEGGRRLILTNREPLEVVFVNTSNFDRTIIKSLV